MSLGNSEIAESQTRLSERHTYTQTLSETHTHTPTHTEYPWVGNSGCL